MLPVTLRFPTTFELKLNPAAFKFPPVMLPAADTRPGVVTLPPAILPVTLNAETTFELKLKPEAFKLPPVILPAADTSPGVVKLPPAMFVVTFRAETTFELRLKPKAFKLPPVMLPEVLMVFEPKSARNVATFELPYVAGMPLAKAILPKI